MEKLWYKTNLDPAGALLDDLDLSFVAGPDPVGEWVWAAGGEDVKNVFKQDWLDYMESKGCPVPCVLVFYKPANFRDNIHRDKVPKEGYKYHMLGEAGFLHYGINLIGNPGYLTGNGADEKYKGWKDTGSMRWYDTEPKNGIPLKGQGADYNYEYIRFPEDDHVTEIGRLDFDSSAMYMVRADIPHQVVTYDQSRLCFSIRGPETVAGSWDSVVTIIKDLGLL